MSSDKIRKRRLRHLALSAALFTAVPLAVAVPSAASPTADGAHGETASAVRPVEPSRADIEKSDLAWAARHSKGGIPWALAKAKRTGEKVLVPNETTATSLTHANPDGSLSSELTPGPERVSEGGRWLDVDARLERTANGTVEAKVHPTGLTLAAGGGTPPTSLRAAQSAAPRALATIGGENGERITLKWKGGLPEPELNGTTATYKDALPGADVIVEATRTGFEQYTRLDKRPEGGYGYTLPLHADGLKATANHDGSVTFTDARTGAKKATMPAPVMWDATVDKVSGKHENRHRVAMKVVDHGGGNIDLVVTPDAKWLADEDTRYPVTIDPSTSVLGNTFDTYVQRGETTDLGAQTELDWGNPGTRNSDGTTRVARSLMTWNTEAFADALISTAKVEFYNTHSGNIDCKPHGWDVWNTTAGSSASRWTAQPDWLQKFATSTETRGNAQGCADTTDGWIKADVKNLVQTWASAKQTRGHMGVRAAEDATTGWKIVNSRNATTNQPKLTVGYNFRPGDGTAQQAGAPYRSFAGVWVVDSTTPTLRDKFTDTDGDTVNGTFQVYDAVTNTPITTPAGDGVIVSGFVQPGAWASVQVPAGQLVDGKTYKFRTNSYDGTHYNLNWSPWREFVVDTTAPGEPQKIASATYPENWGGGGAGVAGAFDVTTGAPDAYEVRYRVDPYEDDADGHGWTSVRTTGGAVRALAPDASYTVTPAAAGNHFTQTRTVDRAGNVGPIKDYGFTAGARDYNRRPKVDIALPQPDLAAAQPVQVDTPQPPGPEGPSGWKGWQPRTFSSGGSTVTVTPLKERSLEGTRKAARALRERAPTRPDPIIKGSWCQPTLSGDAQKSLITRNEACLFYNMTFIQKYVFQGLPVAQYRADFEFAFQVKTDPLSGDIKTWIEIRQIYSDFPGDERAVLLGDGGQDAFIDSMCFSDGCEGGSGAKKFDFFSDLSWKGGGGWNPVDAHAATGTANHKWNGSVNKATGAQDIDLSKTLPVWFVGHFVSESGPPDGKGDKDIDTGPWRSPGVEVRCDKVASNGATPGCVLPQYFPEYKFNTAKYPAAAAHAWLIQHKSKVKGSGKSLADPLKYLPRKERNEHAHERKHNRDRVMCPRYTGPRQDGWVPAKRFNAHSWTYLHPELDGPPESISCDEFPFSSSYQSPGVPALKDGQNPAGANGGGECIQTVAAKVDNGSEHLLDDTRYDAPTFNENCGRSSMSGKVNSGSMNLTNFYEGFLKKFRVIDKDAYTLEPGSAWFRTCDTSKPDLICTMTKP
ncbi:DNRLRE domain-containing protein [Streptomyces uncialis]|uniref:DNRLRE domain-containing protein n=1 Tax=Streptomyces uncialis TaxID=1048205 RepID=UPI003816EEE0